MKRYPLGQAACSLALFFALTPLARASSFSVDPVRVTLSAGQPVAAITVRNDGTEPSVIQLETTAWSQRQGADLLAPTRQILATPPIFTVAPGGTQIVRVGLLRKPDSQRELTYRLILGEIPPPPAYGSTGLRVALRISMPVFVPPTRSRAAPDLRWSARQLPDGRIELTASNVGTAHVQIGTVELSAAGSQAPLAEQQVATYLLPDNSRTWVLKDATHPAPGTALKLSARTDVGNITTRVSLEAAPAAAGSHVTAGNLQP